jgi:hypothetical protein
VEKNDCNFDGRSFRVRTTDKGRRAASASLALLEQFNSVLAKAFTVKER